MTDSYFDKFMRSIGFKALKNYLSAAKLRQAQREGLITLPKAPSKEVPTSKPVMTFRDLMRDLDESRQDR